MNFYYAGIVRLSGLWFLGYERDTLNDFITKVGISKRNSRMLYEFVPKI